MRNRSRFGSAQLYPGADNYVGMGLAETNIVSAEQSDYHLLAG